MSSASPAPNCCASSRSRTRPSTEERSAVPAKRKAASCRPLHSLLKTRINRSTMTVLEPIHNLTANKRTNVLLVGQNIQISAANHELLVAVSRYVSSHFVIFARNLNVLARHEILNRLLVFTRTRIERRSSRLEIIDDPCHFPVVGVKGLHFSELRDCVLAAADLGIRKSEEIFCIGIHRI